MNSNWKLKQKIKLNWISKKTKGIQNDFLSFKRKLHSINQNISFMQAMKHVFYRKKWLTTWFKFKYANTL